MSHKRAREIKALANLPGRLKCTFCLLILLAALPAADCAQPGQTNATIELQIIALNDFHGQLEPPRGAVTLYYNSTGKPFRVDCGGIEYLATQVRGLQATNPHTIVVSAGDIIGASPLVSAIFHDEPTVEALSLAGLAYSAVGNHEFDDGVEELKRLQYGCCNQTDGCQDGDRFVGAGFRFLAANVIDEKTGKTLFPPYEVRYIEGIPVAFIGIALEDTPIIVSRSSIAGLKFLDEADSINTIVQELKQRGVLAIVVLIHNGGEQRGLPSESVGFSGPIEDIVNRSDDEVDLFITGHTHDAYVSRIDGRLVTQAGTQGKLLTDIDLVISRDNGQVISARAKNVATARDVPADPASSMILEKYSRLAEPLAERVVGSINASITRSARASGESALGDLIADSQLHATSEKEGAVAAFTNPGGIRADLIYNSIQSNGLADNVTYEEAFDVQRFGNNLVTMNLFGSQIDALLEQQFNGSDCILQVSRGFEYTWNSSRPAGQRVEEGSIKINKTPVDPDTSYRITVNSFLADGGDNFTVLRSGTDRVYGMVDLDALVRYLKAFSPISPGQTDRIKVVR